MLSKSELYARRAFAALLSATVLANTALIAAAQQPATPTDQTKPQTPSPAPTPDEQEMDRLFEEGNEALNKAEFSTAEKAFQAGLDKAAASKNNTYVARFFNSLGIVCSRSGQFDKALGYFTRALLLVERMGTPQKIATILSNLGNVYRSLSQFDKALDYQNRALALREKLGNPQDIADSLNNLGSVYDDLGQLDNALNYNNRALALREKLNNPEGMAGSLSNLGALYEKLGQFENALNYHNRALALDEKLGNPQDIATSLGDIGIVYNSLGQFDKALDYSTRALALYNNLGNLQDIALSLDNLGSVYNSLGQFDKALDYHNRALLLFEKLGDADNIAKSLNNLSNVYHSLGQFDKTLNYLARSLAIKEKLGNPQAIAASLSNLGSVSERLGQFENALNYHNRALALDEKLRSPQNISSSLNNLGNVYYDLGQFDKALDYHNRALALQEKLGNPQDIAISLNNLGNVYDKLGQMDKALDSFTRSLSLKEKLGIPQSITASLSNLGNVYYDLGQFEKARSIFDRAVQLLESVSNQVGDPDQVGALQDTVKLYTRIAVLRMHQQQPADALVQLERGRAQGLARQLAQSSVDYTAIFSPQDAARWRDANAERTAAANLLNAAENLGIAQKRLTQAKKQVETFSRDKNATPQQKQSAEEELAAAQKQIDAPKARDEAAERQLTVLRTEMRNKYPQFGTLNQAKPPTSAQLSNLARQHPDTLYLQWAVTEEETLLLAMGKQDGIQGFRIAEKAKALRDKALAWRDAIEASGKKDDRDVLLVDKPRYTEEAKSEVGRARALGQLLFAPLTKAGLLVPGRYRRLVLVGDGPLLDLPLAALVMDDGGPDKDKRAGETRLLDRYAVSTAISFGVLTWPGQANGKAEQPLFCVADTANNTRAERFPNTPAQKDVPVVPPASAAGAAVPPRVAGSLLRAGYTALPEARLEGSDIVGMFPGATGLAGPLAREADVRAAMGQADIVHFAVHNTLVPNNPLRSWLLLAPEDENSPYDGRLEGREVVSTKVKARMAVLSACESARGQQRGGDGLMGMAWAFQGAGCPCVVASQWKVDDTASHHLMLRFYEELKAGRRKDDAMQAAMQAVRRDGKHASPYFWACFEVIGDTSPLFAARAQANRSGAVPSSGAHRTNPSIASGRGKGER